MKVLLTGASGFLGRNVMAALLEHEIEVIALTRTRLPFQVEQLEVDLLTTIDFGDLIKKTKATHLIHLAWYAEHGKFWTSPLNLRWVDATVRLSEAFCAAGGQAMVMAGSCAEYDWSHGYCREDATPLNPETLYGISKDTCRRLVMAVATQHQIPCAWARIFLPYGIGENPDRLIPSLISVFQSKKKTFGINASAYRDFLHVTDVAQGLVKLLIEQSNGIYNICSSESVRLENLVKLIAKKLNADPSQVLTLTTERPGEPNLLIGDNFKLKSTGWTQKTTLEQGISQIISIEQTKQDSS